MSGLPRRRNEVEREPVPYHFRWIPVRQHSGRGSLEVLDQLAGWPDGVLDGEGLVVVDRVLKALGAAQEGALGVLPADGSEPGPVYYGVGSGAHMPWSQRTYTATSTSREGRERCQSGGSLE